MLSFSKKKVNEMGLKKSDWQRAGKNGKNCVKNGKIFAFLLIADELFKVIMLIIGGNYLPSYLPLHLCSINIILIAIHAFKPSKMLDNFLYFIGIPGAALALLFPSWAALPLGNFMHIHSFTVHILLITYPIMCLSGGDIIPKAKSFLHCLAFFTIFCFRGLILCKNYEKLINLLFLD